MKKIFKLLWSVLAICCVVWCLCSVLRSASSRKCEGGFKLERMALVDSVINGAIADDDFPGAVLCVVKRADDGESMGEILYLKAYGNRQVCSGKDTVSGEMIPDTIPMTEDAIFDLASVSKCVGTTLSFMRVVENGWVRLSDNVSRYIPGFKAWESTPEKKGERVERQNITLTHLLTHTSGLPAAIHPPTWMKRYEQYGDPMTMNLRDSLTAYLAHDAARMSRPGEVMRYSCLNFITLQAVIERLSGKRMDKFAHDEVFGPLGLKSTWYNAIDDETRPYAEDAPIVPAEVLSDGTLLCGEVHDPTARVVNRGVSGNAGLFSSAEDLAVVASMLLNGGVVRLPKDGLAGKLGATERVRLFSESTVKTFFRVPEQFAQHGRALGWDVSSAYSGSFGELYTPYSIANHTGYTGTSMAMYPDEGVAVIFLTNRVHPYDDGGVSRARATVTNIVFSALDN